MEWKRGEAPHFDACIRYLNEDPWERLRKIKRSLKKTKVVMLLRGKNIVGYRHYSDDVVEAFIKRYLRTAWTSSGYSMR